MNSRAFVRSLTLKEFRALLPAFIAGLTAIGAAFVSSDGRVLLIGALGYSVAAVALGALTVGHEYTHRTMGLLLVQPVDRRYVLLIKLGMLLGLLGVLGAAAWSAPFNTEAWQRPWPWKHPAMVLLPVVVGVFIAPWLTMVCRNTLAGIVFAGTVPGLLMFSGELIGAVRFGVGHPDVDVFRDDVWTRGMVIILAAGALLTWRTFLRLEALDGTGSDVHMPRWFTVERPARRHPVWLLVRKEIHLQQMTLVVVVLFCIGWGTLSLLKDLVPAFANAPVVPVTVIYFVLLSILIGSVASAEERNLGVVQCQLLLPMAAWQQWLVKVAVALGLALVMGVALPILLNYLSPAPDDFEIRRLWRQIAIMIPVLTSFSLYVSSLSSSAVRAVMLSFPALIALLVLTDYVGSSPWITSTGVMVPARGDFVRVERAALEFFVLATLTALVAVTLWTAYQNHRFAERGLGRIATQLLIFLAVPLGAVVLAAGFIVARMLVSD